MDACGTPDGGLMKVEQRKASGSPISDPISSDRRGEELESGDVHVFAKHRA